MQEKLKKLLPILILVLGMGRSAMSILADLWLVLRQPFFLSFFWLLCWTSCVIKVLSGMVFPFKKGYRILSAHTEQLYSSLVVWLHFWTTRKHRQLIYLDLEGKIIHPTPCFILRIQLRESWFFQNCDTFNTNQNK